MKYSTEYGKMLLPISIPHRFGACRASAYGYPVVNVDEAHWNFTGHRACLVILEGTVSYCTSPRLRARHSSQMAKLYFSPAPRKKLNLVAP